MMLTVMGSTAIAAEQAAPPPSIFSPIAPVFEPPPSKLPKPSAPAPAPAATAPAYKPPAAASAPAAPAAKFDIDYTIELAISNQTLKLAFLHIKNGKPEEAAKDLASYRPPTNPYPPLNFIQGLLLRAQGKMFDAIDSFRGAYVMSADQKLKELALFERARTYLALGHHIESRADYMIFLKNYPKSTLSEQAHLGLGQSLMGLKNYGEAVPSFQQAGDNPEARFGEAQALARLGRYDEAERAFKDADAKYPKYLEQSTTARFLYGETMRAEGKPFDARRMLSTIHEGPDRERAALSLARISSIEGHDDEAIRGFEALKGSQDRDIALNSRLELAAIKARTGALADARAILEDIRARYTFGKEYDSAILGLARIDEAEGKYKDAMTHLRELVMRFQPEVKAVDEYEIILKEFLRTGDDEDLKGIWPAIKKWMLDTRREPTLLAVAFRLKKLGEPYMDIIQWLEEHGGREARTTALSELVDHYIHTGDLAKARTYLDRLKSLQGKGAEVQRADAAILFASHDRRGAAARIMSISKPTAEDLLLLGQAYKAAQDPAKAVAYFEKSVDAMNGPPAGVLVVLGDMLYDQGQQAKAYKYYSAAHEIDALNEWAVYRMAVLSAGDKQEELFKLISPSSSIIGKMATSRLREIQIDKALEGR